MKVHLFALLIIFQFLTACKQDQEPAQPLAAAATGIPSASADRPLPANDRPAATRLIFQSTDGGQTWQDVSAGLPTDLNVSSVFAAGGEIFLTSDRGLYHGNASAAPAWEQEFLLNERISCVARGQAGLYACSYNGGLFQNIPGSDIWKNLSDGLQDKTIRTVLETPDGAVFIGTDNGIYKSVVGGLENAVAGGQTWKQVYAGGMVLDIVESGGVLVGGGSQGVLRSTDGGATWEAVLNEHILAKKTGLISDRFVTIFGTRDPSKVSPQGITSRMRISSDGGRTWQRLDQPLSPDQGAHQMDKRLSQVRDVYDIIQVGENIFCSFDTGIYRSSDQGKSWELVLPANDRSGFNLTVSGQVIYAAPGGGC